MISCCCMDLSDVISVNDIVCLTINSTYMDGKIIEVLGGRSHSGLNKCGRNLLEVVGTFLVPCGMTSD